jgi:hypothetical protein
MKTAIAGFIIDSVGELLKGGSPILLCFFSLIARDKEKPPGKKKSLLRGTFVKSTKTQPTVTQI